MTGAAPMPPGALGGSFAWQADAYHDYDSWALHVMPGDIAEIEAAALRTKTAGLDIRKIEKADFALPALAPRLSDLRRRVLEEVGFGYVRGLPVERWDSDFRMRVYWGLSRHIGDPVPQNRNGHLIGHVIDIGTQVDEVNKRFDADKCRTVLSCRFLRRGRPAVLRHLAVGR